MAFIWNPAIYRDSTYTLLARPIHNLDIIDNWDFQSSKVPKQSGGRTAGSSINPVRIEIAGDLAFRGSSGDASVHATELLQIQLYEDMRNKINTIEEQRFEFFMYYDPSDATYYRKFVNCFAVSMKLSLGDETRDPMAYTMTIQADDPTLYKGSSG